MQRRHIVINEDGKIDYEWDSEESSEQEEKMKKTATQSEEKDEKVNLESETSNPLDRLIDYFTEIKQILILEQILSDMDNLLNVVTDLQILNKTEKILDKHIEFDHCNKHANDKKILGLSIFARTTQKNQLEKSIDEKKVKFDELNEVRSLGKNFGK